MNAKFSFRSLKKKKEVIGKPKTKASIPRRAFHSFPLEKIHQDASNNSTLDSFRKWISIAAMLPMPSALFLISTVAEAQIFIDKNQNSKWREMRGQLSTAFAARKKNIFFVTVAPHDLSCSFRVNWTSPATEREKIRTDECSERNENDYFVAVRGTNERGKYLSPYSPPSAAPTISSGKTKDEQEK